MANPNGNPGNKGGGRPSAYAERRNAEELFKIWYGDPEMTIEKLRAKVKSGNCGLRDVFFLKAFSGSETLLKEILKRVHPEQLNLGGDVNVSYVIKRAGKDR